MSHVHPASPPLSRESEHVLELISLSVERLNLISERRALCNPALDDAGLDRLFAIEDRLRAIGRRLFFLRT